MRLRALARAPLAAPACPGPRVMSTFAPIPAGVWVGYGLENAARTICTQGAFVSSTVKGVEKKAALFGRRGAELGAIGFGTDGKRAVSFRRLSPAVAAGVPRRWFAVGDTHTVAVPDMGDSITEGELADWNVAVGDTVFVDDVLCEIETDKVTAEVKATFNGTVAALLAEPGDTVTKAQALITMVETEGGGAPPAPAPAAPAPTAPAPVAPAPAAPAPPTAAASAAAAGRSPMIQFRYGVREAAASAAAAAPAIAAISADYANHIDPEPSAFIRRRPLPADEIELIMVSVQLQPLHPSATARTRAAC